MFQRAHRPTGPTGPTAPTKDDRRRRRRREEETVATRRRRRRPLPHNAARTADRDRPRSSAPPSAAYHQPHPQHHLQRRPCPPRPRPHHCILTPPPHWPSLRISPLLQPPSPLGPRNSPAPQHHHHNHSSRPAGTVVHSTRHLPQLPSTATPRPHPTRCHSSRRHSSSRCKGGRRSLHPRHHRRRFGLAPNGCGWVLHRTTHNADQQLA